MASISFGRATRVYEDGVRPALKELDLQVADGEFLVLVGPSGCGKSTTLRMVAGLEPVDSGRILLGDMDVTHVDPKERDVAMVFQNYALYPHMSVADNMGFALKCAGVAKSEIQGRVLRVAQLLGIHELLERRPKALSGGQRQRVAMGRAIVRNPQAFLMDEPLSNLDAQLRMQMRSQIARLQRKLGTTMLYVTHDQTEALTMGDRIAVLNQGVLQQVGSPRELYQHPANRFVAEFVGSPAMNLLPFSVRFDVCSGLLKLGEAAILLPPKLAELVGRHTSTRSVLGSNFAVAPHASSAVARGNSEAGTGGMSDAVLCANSKIASSSMPEVIVGARPEHLQLVLGWHFTDRSGSGAGGLGGVKAGSSTADDAILAPRNIAGGTSGGTSGGTFGNVLGDAPGDALGAISGTTLGATLGTSASLSEVAIPLVVDLVEELGADSYIYGRIPGRQKIISTQTGSSNRSERQQKMGSSWKDQGLGLAPKQSVQKSTAASWSVNGIVSGSSDQIDFFEQDAPSEQTDFSEQDAPSSQLDTSGKASESRKVCEGTEVTVVVRVSPDHGLRFGDRVTATLPVDKLYLFAADEAGLLLT